MSGSNGPPRRFRVSQAPGVTAAAEQLFRDAQGTGQSVAFALALKRIVATLRARPREFGEPMFNYKHAQLEIRLGIMAPAVVRYAVHRTADEVLILAVEVLSPK